MAGLALLYVDAAGVLRLLGAGNSDYLDVLAEPGTRFDWLFRDCASAEFQDVPADSPLMRGAPASARIEAAEPCPVLELPESVEGWREQLPHGIKRNLRRYGQRLGDIRFETSSDPGLVEQLFRLHSARWGVRGEPGVLANGALQGFHREVAESFAARGWLRFWAGYANGRLAALIYAFVSRRRAYMYLGGFEPELARFGPGTLVLGYAIERAIGESVREIHFLRGAEAYKYAWGARDRRNVRILIGAGTRADGGENH